MNELEKRIYAQQCNALAKGNLELYEVLRQAHEALSKPPVEIKVIIDRGVVHDVLKPIDCTNCSVEIVYIDPDEGDYEEMKARRDALYEDSSLESVL